MADGFRTAGTGLLLLWAAIADLRYRKIKRSELLVISVAMLAFGLTERMEGWLRIGGVVFGILVVCICKLSAEALGLADGYMILAYGAAFGLQRVSLLCFISFVFSAAAAGGLYVLGRIGRKGRIPFLPFFLAGYLVTLFF